ncbi:CitMHS family transporter [Sphingosinithalassobacter portus]|uniref:CitMHS family transporter n=1 Tax=Stakelama portus TaxID=2676234 RepID=UPI000D6E6030|nr:citrate:proton symporter [Sphingosinithalassobacter portus]
MLALAGLATILFVLAAILTKRLSPLVALVAIPLVAALLLGDAGKVGKYMADGVVTVAPMAAMFLFAILFFSILSDAGLFRPIVAGIVRLTRDHPPRVAIGTAILTSIVHLDGSGAATFLIVVPALLPVYDRLGLDRRMLACIVAMAAGVGNMLPWGGPTLRAATSLNVPVMELFAPLLPVYAVGLVTMLGFSWWIGTRQMRRARAPGPSFGVAANDVDAEPPVRLNLRYWFNIATVLAVIGLMLATLLPPAIAFLIGAVVAITVNFPEGEAQREAIQRHAPAAIWMVAILFAAGAFTGILRGTGMLDAMAQGGAALLPDGSASLLPTLTGLASMPLSFFFDPDSFYFGVLPVLGGIAEHGGVPAVEVGRAAILGQMTTGFPVSPLTPATFLLVGLAGVELADHQRYAIGYLFALSVVMTIAALLFGVIGL